MKISAQRDANTARWL